MLQTLPYPPDILLLSETKIKLSPLTNDNLTGYQSVILANSQTNAGGVGVGETGYERNTGMVVTVNFSPYVVNARPRNYLSTFLVCSRIFHQFSEATGSHTKIL